MASTTLVGRAHEQSIIDGLLAGARASQSGVLVVEGEPGIGKTALFEHARRSAAPMSVLSDSGIQSELDLPFGGLTRLLRAGAELPGADAAVTPEFARQLEAARPGEARPMADRFAAGAEILAILSSVAEQAPLLVVVDDAQWVDDPSIDALAFVARRLHAEGIVLLIGRRAGEGSPALDGLPSLRLRGLDPRSAELLLAAWAPAPLDPARVETLVGATGGNPLALVELPFLLDRERLLGLVPSYEPLPVGRHLVEAYGEKVRTLPEPCQEALVVAAVLDVADSRLLHDALAHVERTVDDLSAAEDAGLVTLSPQGVVFRHPLVRSAITQITPAGQRRRCHRAVAASLAGSNRPDDEGRRAWHLAAAAPGLDDTAADLLEEAGGRATRAAGFSSASHAFERAAQLTYDREVRRRRFLAAAGAAYQAGQGGRAQELLTEAAGVGGSASGEFDLLRLQGRLDTWQGHPRQAFDRLVTAAHAEADPRLSAQLLLDAVVASAFSGAPVPTLAAAEEALALAPASDADTALIARLAVGAGHMLLGESHLGLPLLAGHEDLIALTERSHDSLPYVSSVAFCLLLGDDLPAATRLLEAVVSAATKRGATSALPFALTVRAHTDFRLGAWDAALAGAHLAAELAADMSRSTDLAHAQAVLALIAAAQGRDDDCHRLAAESTERAAAAQALSTEVHCHSALALLELGHGRADRAIAPLERAEAMCRSLGLMELTHWQWAADLLEARVRCGSGEGTAELASLLSSHGERSRRALPQALAARAAGLLDDSEGFDAHFATALGWHAQVRRPFETGRTHLCFGERLRRVKRRGEARRQLEAALDIFTRLGAVPWAERARSELAAAGTALSRPQRLPTDVLTPQELQIALTVIEGATNRDVAARMFLSPKTVEYHLGHVYRKLQVSSREELKTVLRHDGDFASAGPAPR